MNQVTKRPFQSYSVPRRHRVQEKIRYFLKFSLQNPGFLFGMIVIGSMLFMAAFPSVIAPHSPTEANPHALLQPPSSEHFFGTDSNGMDIFSRVVWSPRIDLLVAISSVSIAFVFGVPVGSVLGYFAGRGGLAGRIEEFVMRGFDVFQAFPIFVLALAIMAVLGRSLINVVAVLTFLNFPIFVRLTRSTVLAVRSRAFIEAARVSGNSEVRIVFRHIMPNSLSPALINASVLTGGAMLITAGLSFVGAGVPPPTPEWGLMVSIGASDMITGNWWPAVFPGAALGLAVLSFALVGDGLRSYLDPTKRR